MSGEFATPPRRVEALAYINERIERSGTSPSLGEIGRAMRPPVEQTRVRQLLAQLVKLGVIERPIASRRGIRIRDLALCRRMIAEALGQRGWAQSQPLGELVMPPCTNGQLALIPLILHNREVN